MKFFIQPYSKTLKKAFHFKNSTLWHRKGFLIGVSDCGYQGWGDVSPLVGFSSESYAEAWHDALHSFPFMTDPQTRSVQWAMSVALSMIQSQKEKISLAQFWANALGTMPLKSVMSSLLYTPSQNQSLLDHCPCLKMKLGRKSLQEDQKMVLEVVKKYQPHSLRFDINRLWNIDQALEFSHFVRKHKLNVEFIEEPCSHSKDTITFAQKIDIPLALDETLYLDDWKWKSHISSIPYFILKPSLIGSFNKIQNILDCIGSSKVVISSVFESEVGRLTLGELAKACQTEDIYSGLGTGMSSNVSHMSDFDILPIFS